MISWSDDMIWYDDIMTCWYDMRWYDLIIWYDDLMVRLYHPPERERDRFFYVDFAEDRSEGEGSFFIFWCCWIPVWGRGIIFYISTLLNTSLRERDRLFTYWLCWIPVCRRGVGFYIDFDEYRYVGEGSVFIYWLCWIPVCRRGIVVLYIYIYTYSDFWIPVCRRGVFFI